MMVMATNTTVAIHCTQCGEIEFQVLSLFAFSGKERPKMYCQCGAPLFSVASRNRQQFTFAYQCALCEGTHYLRFNRKAVWGKDVLPLICPEMETAVGFIGPRQKVAMACQEQEKTIGELAAELGYEDEFENPEAMLKLLDHLHRLAKHGELGCGCGNYNLSFELLPDRIELYCEYCEALGIIYVDGTDKIRSLESMSSLFLEENKTWVINHLLRGPHLAKANEEE